jgi:hypothetical protein
MTNRDVMVSMSSSVPSTRTSSGRRPISSFASRNAVATALASRSSS